MDSNELKSTGDPAATSKHAILIRRLNFRMIRNCLLIWLDNNINEEDDDCRNTLTKLRAVVDTVQTYTNVDHCVEFLQKVTNDKIYIIISGFLGELMVPQIHNITHVDTIFIFCDNKQYGEQLAKEWSKIKGVFTEIASICDVLQTTARMSEQNNIPISFLDTTEDISQKKLDQLDSSFMYSQILKEILLSIQFQSQHFKQFIQYCREVLFKDSNEPTSVKELEQHYYDKKPIFWYTCPSFVYDTLNRALRLMDANTIIHMGFFIHDLHHHIEQLHQEQFIVDRLSENFTVYRGQALSTAHFKQLCQTKGGLLSFNNFLSTTKDREVALQFVQATEGIPDAVGVLFIMLVHPDHSSTPFASIANVSYYADQESEILFSMHTVFRIGDIVSLNEDDRFFKVMLTLTNDDDKDLRRLTDYIRGEPCSSDKDWFKLGSLLMKMGQADKAQEVYEMLLKQTTDEDERGWLFDQLGNTYSSQGSYKKAITFYEQSLMIRQRTLPSDHPVLADTYNNIGYVYSSISDYEKALLCHEKALKIQHQSLPSNHTDLADSYNHIGNVYYMVGDYTKALFSLEKAREIREQSLLPNHPDLATSYHNVGSAFHNMADYAKALSSYKKALTIRQQSLLPTDPLLATSYNNIGSVCFAMGDYANALSSYEKAQSILQQSLPPSHPHLAISCGNIGNVYSELGDYAKALSSFEKALTIQEQSLPANHPHMATGYNHIGLVYDKMGDYAKALMSYEKALAIQQQLVPSNHLDLAATYNNIGLLYYNIDDYVKALPFFEKALTTKKQLLPSNHPDLAIAYNNIGSVYENINDYAQAFSSYERAVNIAQHSLPFNHPSLQLYRNNLDTVKKFLK